MLPHPSGVLVERRKTAIGRTTLSRPIQQAISDGILSPNLTVFDFGCGRGNDVRLLKEDGYEANGWDPSYSPHTAKQAADMVNLGYVINVIEDPQERQTVLRESYALSRQCLIVAAQLTGYGRPSSGEQLGDGVLTKRRTFQKYYSQEELREYIASVLGVEPVAAAPGIYYVFREESARQAFLLRQVSRKRVAAPRQVKPLQERYAQHIERLRAFAERVETLGRLPRGVEFPNGDGLRELGSPRRWARICERLFEGFKLEDFRARASQDLLVYIALSRFHRRPRFGTLPQSLQWDIRDFFGSYQRACELGDAVLFKAGVADDINAACETSKVGKLLPRALYVHVSALGALTPLLRVYLGCGRALVGEVGANLLKVHRFTGKISYLSYPNFDEDPHPALAHSLSVNLRTRDIWERDYTTSTNPPILHRKETFVEPSYPRFAEFAQLTRSEEEAGLLDSPEPIGFREQWNDLLRSKGYSLHEHRLVRTTC